ncbi:TPA: hypothetical protein JI406_RS16915 [Acinetobacter baumannii]|nr:hypothetical protein [Acinetobacter baumannii]
MTRGFLNSIQDYPEYRSSEKNWHVTLDLSNFFWYDLIVNPPENTLKSIKSYLNDFKDYVEKTNEKKFIYFFTSRKKVRFNIEKQPKFYWLDKSIMSIDGLVENKIKKKFEIKLPKDNIPDKVCVDEKFIYFYYGKNVISYSVHDFIKICNINLGITSEIHYIGITSDPVKRTLSRVHRGYADMLYHVSTSENDIFLTINTFKVASHTSIESRGLNIISTNSMIYDVDWEKEGSIIEKALIYYFNAKCQHVDKNAWGEFRNLLGVEMKDKNIKSVSFHLELNEPTEYDIIGSQDIPPNLSHSFRWELVDGEPKLFKFDSEISLMKDNNVLVK